MSQRLAERRCARPEMPETGVISFTGVLYSEQGGSREPYMPPRNLAQCNYTVRHKKLHRFVFAITLSYLSLFEYLLVHIYRDKFGTN